MFLLEVTDWVHFMLVEDNRRTQVSNDGSYSERCRSFAQNDLIRSMLADEFDPTAIDSFQHFHILDGDRANSC